MDPHKRSATIEVMTGDETIVAGGRFGTGRDGYAAMKTYAKQWPDRVWAIEGCQGIGRHIANRLLGDGGAGFEGRLSAGAGSSHQQRELHRSFDRPIDALRRAAIVL
jgi:hypothetical protein